MVVIISNRICCDMKEYGCSPNFIVMWRQLVEKLLHAILLSHRVHVGHLVVGQGGEEEVHLGTSMVSMVSMGSMGSSIVTSDFHGSGAVVGAD